MVIQIEVNRKGPVHQFVIRRDQHGIQFSRI